MCAHGADGSELTHAEIIAPVLDGDGCSDKLERQNGKPCDGVVPSHSEAPGRVNEATNISKESAVDGVQDGQLSEGLAREKQHDSDDHVANNEGGRTA